MVSLRSGLVTMAGRLENTSPFLAEHEPDDSASQGGAPGAQALQALIDAQHKTLAAITSLSEIIVATLPRAVAAAAPPPAAAQPQP